MPGSVLASFVRLELDAYTRKLLLDAVEAGTTGQKRFGFDLYNVYLDFEEGMALIQDVCDVSAIESVPLVRFCEALTPIPDEVSDTSANP